LSFAVAHTFVGEKSAPKLAFVLHGVLGAGHNFRSFIRGLHAERGDYGFVLVDQRLHGASTEAPPPHTLAACADDLARLSALLERAPSTVIGHSFGGKVALEYARRHPNGLEQVWVLDAQPGAIAPEPDHEVLTVLEALRSVPVPAPSRDAAVTALTERGIARPTAAWLATSLKRTPNGYVFNLGLDGMDELLSDYFQTDLWPFLETPRDAPDIFLVVAEQGDLFSPELRRRAVRLPPEARVKAHLLEDSGHWVHVDNPDGLRALISRELA